MIKPCTAPDSDWLALRIALWPTQDEEAHREEMEQLCAQPERYAQFMAYADDGNVQGFVEIALRTDYVNGTNSSPVAFLEGIYVRETFRDRGVARALLAKAEQWALSHNCSEIASDALLENTGSRAMHRSLGFQETERVVYFRKQLPQPGNNESTTT
jgi:aminoglycoside 6'-N-acetyltransferase I